jgi:radical SAM protein with 4Fe4S-binding SPASM domain
MKAKLVERNQQRKILGEVLPLATPFSVMVQVSNVCNFRCNYCSQSLGTAALKAMLIEKRTMPYEVFVKAADQIKTFPEKVKVMNLTGFGEPLLNKHLPEMIRYTKENQLAERIEIVTNGSFLTPDLSDRLIDAGLDIIRISVQGLSADKYREVSGIDLDFDQYVANIGYFYSHKKAQSMYIKILDSALEQPDDQERFFEIFGDICDIIAVEHLVPVMPGVDYSKLKSTYENGMQGYKNEKIVICPRPFYQILVDVDGTVRPCCNYIPPMILGTIHEASLVEHWNSQIMHDFQLQQVNGERFNNPVCRDCQTPVYGINAEDNLDAFKEKIHDGLCHGW